MVHFKSGKEMSMNANLLPGDASVKCKLQEFATNAQIRCGVGNFMNI